MTEHEMASSDVDRLLLSGYQHVVESGRWDRRWLSETTGVSPQKIDEVQSRLASLQLIRRDTSRPDGWSATSPLVAMAKLVAPIDRDVRRGAAYAEQLREQLAALMPVHKVRYGSDMINFVEAVPDAAALRTVLDDEAAKSQTSIMLMDPGIQETGADHERYLEAGSRGVRIRMVFPHGTRYDAAAEGDMQTLNHAGVQCRTADELPLRLVAFDDVTCVLGMDDDVPDDESAAVALVVRHPLLKATLVGVFEHAWLRAMPYTHTDPRPVSVSDGLSRSILRLLATGAKDDAIARRLNISVRTCRRHVSDLMENLGVASRFQAGVEAHRHGLV